MAETIGRYQIRRMLGRGGMATVYLGHDPTFDREVAIKLLSRETLNVATFRDRFSREARTIARLGHSAIVPVFDFGEHEGQPFLVMAYMPGGSLAERLKDGPLDPPTIIQIVDRVSSALEAAHGQGLIHRDVKPQNILFDQYGYAYLSDFGVVKLGEGETQLTGTGAMVGTPAYMAPEMAEANGVSPLADVYALGVTLYQMFTGALPYDAATPVGMLMAHMSKPVPDLREARPDLPESLQAVIEKALAKDPASRYQRAGEITRDLRLILSADPSATLPDMPIPATMQIPAQELKESAVPTAVPSVPGQPAPVEQPRRSAPVWLIGGAVALFMCVGLVALAIGASRIVGPETVPGLAGANGNTPDGIPSPTVERFKLEAREEMTAAAWSDATATRRAADLAVTQEAQATQTADAAALAEAVRNELVDVPGSWDLFMQERFDTNEDGFWTDGIFSDDFGSVDRAVSGGAYRWDADSKQSMISWVSIDTTASLPDFYASVTTLKVSGPLAARSGLAFRNDGSQFYMFVIENDRDYEVWRRSAGTWTRLTSGRSNWIVPDSANQVAVKAEGSQFTFYVNNQYVTDLQDRILTRGAVTFVIEITGANQQATFTFDDFLVFSP